MAEAVKKDDLSTLNLYQKLAKITGEIGAIKKDGRNREQNFDFISYAAVGGELRTLFAKYGVIVVPRMAQTHRQKRETFSTSKGSRGTTVLIDFVFTVVNADKPDDKFTVTWTGEATDYGDKGTNKAATSALKYYLMRQFNISEKGEDPDEHSPVVTVETNRTPVSALPNDPPVVDASKQVPTDDILDEIQELMMRLKGTPAQIRQTNSKIHTMADAIAVRDKLANRVAVPEDIAPPEQTA